MINVFIGYDSKEKVAFNTLAYSILRNSTKPVSITPIYLPNLRDDFVRERNNLSSTEFSFSRFMVPHLMNYKGWGVFMDCDQLMLGDIAELWRLRDDKYAVQLCKHNYTPKEDKKFLGCLRRNDFVTVLFKQKSNEVPGEFLGRLVLGIEDDQVKIFGATIF